MAHEHDVDKEVVAQASLHRKRAGVPENDGGMLPPGAGIAAFGAGGATAAVQGEAMVQHETLDPYQTTARPGDTLASTRDVLDVGAAAGATEVVPRGTGLGGGAETDLVAPGEGIDEKLEEWLQLSGEFIDKGRDFSRTPEFIE